MTDYLHYSGNDPDLAEWLKSVDRLAYKRIGVSIFDMPDYLWADSYRSGDSPEEGLADAIEYWEIEEDI
jgi:hypothetical protein